MFTFDYAYKLNLLDYVIRWSNKGIRGVTLNRYNYFTQLANSKDKRDESWHYKH